MSTTPHRTRTAARLSPLLGAALICTACTGPSTPSPTPEAPSSPTESAPESSPPPALNADGLEALTGMNVFFGHRSVGANIVEMGMPAVYQDFGLAVPGESFSDQSLDQTDDPSTKIADFDRWVRDEGVGGTADLAFMKLGYIDILAETDVQGVFDRYRSTMDALEADYPEVVFLHATVSVTAWVPEDNAAIERFNVLMRDRYGSSGLVFDLAATVSTCADGVPLRDETEQGEIYYSICPEYTHDGGHLNELGAKVAAEEMLRVLISAMPVP
jgi:hypothetical protein